MARRHKRVGFGGPYRRSVSPLRAGGWMTNQHEGTNRRVARPDPHLRDVSRPQRNGWVASPLEQTHRDPCRDAARRPQPRPPAHSHPPHIAGRSARRCTVYVRCEEPQQSPSLELVEGRPNGILDPNTPTTAERFPNHRRENAGQCATGLRRQHMTPGSTRADPRARSASEPRSDTEPRSRLTALQENA